MSEEPAPDPVIIELNKHYALVILGQEAVVMVGEGDREYPWGPMSRSSKSRLLINGSPTSYPYPEDEDKEIPLAKYWLTHPERQEFRGVTFAPGNAVCPPGYYNFWTGFTVQPCRGACGKFLDHLFENVCDRDERLYLWTLGWFAQIIQQPDNKPGTALCLRGKQGVGKTIVGEIFGSLLGPHHLLIADPRFISGKFNAHMASLLLLQADEAFWAGDQKHEGKLKDLITGKYQMLEPKGINPFPIRNHMRLLVTGNADWQVPAGFGERRFTVLDVSDQHMQDHAYFAAIMDEMNNGGREALLDELLRFDLIQVNLRANQYTTALLEQQIASLPGEKAWWLDILQRGRLPFGSAVGTCPSITLWKSYLQHSNRTGVRGKRAIETALGMLLHKLVPGLRKLRDEPYEIFTERGDRANSSGTVYEFRRCATVASISNSCRDNA